MRKTVYLGAFALLGTLGLTGCDVASETVTPTSCQTVPISCSGGVLEACANEFDTWYQINGSRVCSVIAGSSSCVQQATNECRSRPEAKPDGDMTNDILEMASQNVKLQRQVNELMGAMNADIVESQQDINE
jgi:hypothetical protein